MSIGFSPGNKLGRKGRNYISLYTTWTVKKTDLMAQGQRQQDKCQVQDQENYFKGYNFAEYYFIIIIVNRWTWNEKHRNAFQSCFYYFIFVIMQNLY